MKHQNIFSIERDFKLEKLTNDQFRGPKNAIHDTTYQTADIRISPTRAGDLGEGGRLSGRLTDNSVERDLGRLP